MRYACACAVCAVCAVCVRCLSCCVADHLKEGQAVRVKVLETDEKGRVKLSMKALAERNTGEQAPQQPQS